jgi:hypothetical protein
MKIVFCILFYLDFILCSDLLVSEFPSYPSRMISRAHPFIKSLERKLETWKKQEIELVYLKQHLLDKDEILKRTNSQAERIENENAQNKRDLAEKEITNLKQQILLKTPLLRILILKFTKTVINWKILTKWRQN